MRSTVGGKKPCINTPQKCANNISHRPRSRLGALVQRPSNLLSGTNFLDRAAIELVNAVISNHTARSALSSAARNHMLSPLKAKGLLVSEYIKCLEDAAVYESFEEVRDPNVVYPDYYLVKFHAYEDGHLNWGAAFESRYVWYVVASRAMGLELSPDVADTFSATVAKRIRSYLQKHRLAEPIAILDVGCGTGFSTQGLKANFPDASVAGVDASPHYIAIAVTEERLRGTDKVQGVQFRHAVFETSDVADRSADMVVFRFVFHECPPDAINMLLAKAARALRPGGVVVMVDIDPHSSIAAKRPAFVKALRWSTEPWLAEYERLDFLEILQSSGFTGAERFPVTGHHHGYIATI